MNFIVQMRSKCGQGGGNQKFRKLCGHHTWKLPYTIVPNSVAQRPENNMSGRFPLDYTNQRPDNSSRASFAAAARPCPWQRRRRMRKGEKAFRRFIVRTAGRPF